MRALFFFAALVRNIFRDGKYLANYAVNAGTSDIRFPQKSSCKVCVVFVILEPQLKRLDSFNILLQY